MSFFPSKAFSSRLHARQIMRIACIVTLVLIGPQQGTSDQPNGSQPFEVLPPPASEELLPPVPPQDVPPGLDDLGRPRRSGIAPRGSGIAPIRSMEAPLKTPKNASRATDQIIELMDQLKTQQRDLRQMGDRDNAIAGLDAEVTRNSIDQSLHVQRINDRILYLRDILQRSKNCEDTEQTQRISPSKVTRPNPSPASVADSNPAVPYNQRDRIDDPEPVASAFVVTENAVDRLSLANNLFAAGQIDLAQRIYAELRAAEPAPNDRVWIEYQLANCYRRRGDIKHAEKLYRIVAGSNAGLYWTERARWWMDNLVKVQRFADRQSQLVATLDNIKEGFHETSEP